MITISEAKTIAGSLSQADAQTIAVAAVDVLAALLRSGEPNIALLGASTFVSTLIAKLGDDLAV